MAMNIRRQLRIAALTSLAVSLTGCDVAEIAQQMGLNSNDTTVYLPPMVELQIDENETAYALGYDKCPSGNNWFLALPLKHPEGCLKLEPNTVEMKVSLRSLSGENWTEVWGVSRKNDSVTLIRPNGFEIRNAEQRK
ncbi:hypothetical protein [Vibrio anguillarum]|uniref:Lipoprotein n=1 Tax=Vibrio anguillarum TaxID=55601 RepID=A0AAW4BQ19_VIBAN|nr:hypothetical protein [Vibrio anguillarum]MBF4374506.1 hypothetical protein [Vibrio anguillarum]MBF4437068.1 hypothetical protein [Vibrio anguillarum]